MTNRMERTGPAHKALSVLVILQGATLVTIGTSSLLMDRRQLDPSTERWLPLLVNLAPTDRVLHAGTIHSLWELVLCAGLIFVGGWRAAEPRRRRSGRSS